MVKMKIRGQTSTRSILLIIWWISNLDLGLFSPI
jgi:hypothetical protein